jgi:phosphatidylserine/phosphatidylglycerophosphate/cardiolipin synthase-like enzyme
MAGVEMLSPKCTFEADNHPWKNPIKEFGVPTLERGDVLHHKFGVIDNKIVVIGSQNWSDAANYVNDETLVVIEASGISEQYGREYNRLLAKSRLGVPATIKKEITRLETDCAGRGFYF